jgi:hypothetical protein
MCAALENPNPSIINTTHTGPVRRGRESVSAMQLDPAKYSHHLHGLNLSDEDQLRFMEQLWTIMESFVDRAFGESAEQILLGIDGDRITSGVRGALDSELQIHPTFNDAAQEDAARKSLP